MTNHESESKRKKPLDPRKCSWKENFENESLSGIEFRRMKTNEIVNFIAIMHDELLDNKAFRIAVSVDDNSTFTLPPKQTFDEMIQAKRRQQMLLYGSGGGGGGGGGNTASSNSGSLSDRAARRVAAAARRQQALTAAIQRQNSRSHHSDSSRSESLLRRRPAPVTQQQPQQQQQQVPAPLPQQPPASKPLHRSRHSASRRIRKRPPKVIKSQSKSITPPSITEPNNNISPARPAPIQAAPVKTQPISGPISDDFLVKSLDASGTQPPPHRRVVTSVKDLFKHSPQLHGLVDPKKIKLILKDAPPGAHLTMPDGTVIKKSRRGGARAGAGRKRSRPVPNGQHSEQTDPQPGTSKDNSLNASASTDECPSFVIV